MEIILPLFKGKGAKANNKDNYRGRTLFPTLCNIYEMILLNRLEKYVIDNEYFSELQFGFRGEVDCIEASSTILAVVRCSVISFTSAKPLIQFGLMDYFFKLFSELGIKGGMWLAIKDLHTDVKAKVLYAGSLSKETDILQDTGQGRILAPFMHKLYINSLLKALLITVMRSQSTV